MPKGQHLQRKTIRLERLKRFLAWAGAAYPDFEPKKNHQEQWFNPYVGYPYPDFGRAAKAFWLGLEEPAVRRCWRIPIRPA